MSANPVALIILDGFGVGPSDPLANAIQAADTPYIDKLFAECPNSKLITHGRDVGLPEGQMGNSEVGHMTIGSGRIIKQDLPRISDDLSSGAFEEQPGFQGFLKESEHSRAIHLVGLLSNGGVHAHGNHTLGLCKIFNKPGKPVFIHAITDGRDADPKAGQEYLTEFESSISTLPNVHLASVIGRYYAMDRDKNWDRTEQTALLYTQHEGRKFSTLSKLFSAAYTGDIFDEFISPSFLALPNGLDSRIKPNDAVFFTNFRVDRMRQLPQMLLDFKINGRERTDFGLGAVATMTPYGDEFDGKVHVIYPKEETHNTLGQIVAKAGLTQLRIAETEKYPHVTYYLNAGREKEFAGEARILVPSPKVDTYDQKPEMSLPGVTEELLNRLNHNHDDFIALNIANGDMVGHTGDLEAAKQAVEAIDHALSQIIPAIKAKGGQALIIADHGNADEMIIDGKPSTQHSTNPVPCIYVGKEGCQIRDGSLANVAATIVEMMDLGPAPEMQPSLFTLER